MCIDLKNSIVFLVPSYFKIISFLFFFLSSLLAHDYLGIILLFCILLFINLRSKINFKIYKIDFFDFIIILLTSIICHLQFIYIFQFLLIFSYIKYLLYTNNYLDLDNSFYKIFKHKLLKYFYKYKIIKNNFKLYIKTNYSMYGKKYILKSLYLSIKNIDCTKYENLKKYVIKSSKSNLYDYLFVFMHAVSFIFCFLLEVYK